MELPAKNIDEETSQRVRQMAMDTFRVLNCEGLSRVDFFLREDGSLIVNEINTLPGFTAISMYPRLWEISGITLPRLTRRLVEIAQESYVPIATLTL